jgi:hypothetical protein
MEKYESSSESISAISEEIIEKTILLEKKQQGIPGFPIITILVALVIFYFFACARMMRTLSVI